MQWTVLPGSDKFSWPSGHRDLPMVEIPLVDKIEMQWLLVTASVRGTDLGYLVNPTIIWSVPRAESL